MVDDFSANTGGDRILSDRFFLRSDDLYRNPLFGVRLGDFNWKLEGCFG